MPTSVSRLNIDYKVWPYGRRLIQVFRFIFLFLTFLFLAKHITCPVKTVQLTFVFGIAYGLANPLLWHRVYQSLIFLLNFVPSFPYFLGYQLSLRPAFMLTGLTTKSSPAFRLTGLPTKIHYIPSIITAQIEAVIQVFLFIFLFLTLPTAQPTRCFGKNILPVPLKGPVSFFVFDNLLWLIL